MSDLQVESLRLWGLIIEEAKMNKLTCVLGHQPNWNSIERLIDDGYISKRVHQENDSMHIFNYTAKTQYDQNWTRDTLMCRGLVAHDGDVVARPFSKFFNYSEFTDVQVRELKGPWRVFEKLDGSLGILYKFADGDYRICTRGSFHSPQAQWATEWFKSNHSDFAPAEGETWLFEIIYPENRIVVDYGDTKGLFLLDVIDTSTGHRMIPMDHPFPEREHFGLHDKPQIPDERDNKEGYVLVNEHGFRLKIKHSEYMRLHKIITGCSSRTVWEYLKEGKPFSELTDNVPDEFYQWLENTKTDLMDQFQAIANAADNHYEARPDTDDRKILAEYFKLHSQPHICFALLDGRDYQDNIWKQIKPERVLPYVNDSE